MGARRKETAPEVPDRIVRVTVGIHRGLLERARNCAYHEPGVTLADLVRRGLESLLARYERSNGGAYPARRGALRRGRLPR